MPLFSLQIVNKPNLFIFYIVMIYLTRTEDGTWYNNFKVRTVQKRVYPSASTTYLFMKIVNDITKEEFYTYLDVSSTLQNWELVNFAGGQATDIGLEEEVFHTYTIYETTATGLNVDTTLIGDTIYGRSTAIERGKIFLVNDRVTEVSYTEYTPTDVTNTTNKNKVYLNI